MNHNLLSNCQQCQSHYFPKIVVWKRREMTAKVPSLIELKSNDISIHLGAKKLIRKISFCWFELAEVIDCGINDGLCGREVHSELQ